MFKPAKVYVISILWGCIFGRQTRWCFFTIPGLAQKRQSIAYQMNPNCLTGLSFYGFTLSAHEDWGINIQ
jgi:hypothetical protein